MSDTTWLIITVIAVLIVAAIVLYISIRMAIAEKKNRCWIITVRYHCRKIGEEYVQDTIKHRGDFPAMSEIIKVLEAGNRYPVTPSSCSIVFLMQISRPEYDNFYN